MLLLEDVTFFKSCRIFDIDKGGIPGSPLNVFHTIWRANEEACPRFDGKDELGFVAFNHHL